MKKIIITILILIQGIALSGLPFFAQASLSPVVFKSSDVLSVSGNQILANGQAIVLRGVAVGSPHFRKYSEKRNANTDYAEIKNTWQANTVRISMHPGVWQDDPMPAHWSLEAEVKAARDLGLFVIIDWHSIGAPNGWSKTSDSKTSLYTYSSDFNLAKDFWRYAGEKFKNDQGVIFEIWNEPRNAQNNLAWKQNRGYMQGLYDVIRGKGAKNIILAPGVYWTYDLRGIKDTPLKGNNIAYAWHNYKNFTNLTWDQALDGLDKIYPVVLTEWGYQDSENNKYGKTNEKYATALRDFILDHNLSFTAWCWSSDWQPAMFNDNWSGLTEYGRFAKEFLLNFSSLKETRQESVSVFEEKVKNFVLYGIDEETRKLSSGERSSALSGYQNAFGRSPDSEAEFNDLVRIATGYWPSAISNSAETKSKARFKKLYGREADLNIKKEKNAIKILAYGVQQRVGQRNLEKEKKALKLYQKKYKNFPQTVDDWNALQALAYAGVK